jgi:MFS transporter, DHA3 family, macrolide efflux protein
MQTYNMRTFYTIIATQTLSIIGSRISGLALGIWIFQQTGNVTPLALVAFFSMVPQVVLSNVAGVLADRWDRRLLMAIADMGQAVGTVILLALFATGNFQIWHLYLVASIQALFSVFQQPAFDASVTMLVPDDQRDRANAIRQMTHPAAGIIAPALAGLVFAFFGVIGAIVIDLATFIVAFSVILLVSIPKPRKTQEGAKLAGSFLYEMLGGFRFLWARPVLFLGRNVCDADELPHQYCRDSVHTVSAGTHRQRNRFRIHSKPVKCRDAGRGYHH